MPAAKAVTAGLTHAGGVVTAPRRGAPTVLLARASRPPHDWVLPKGHIEPGETPEQTARREVLEETGVEAGVIASLGDVTFVYRQGEVRVRYFLMRFERMGTAQESREIRWCTLDEAEHLLTFASIKHIVRLAAARADGRNLTLGIEN